jgi:hypothetical protein
MLSEHHADNVRSCRRTALSVQIAALTGEQWTTGIAADYGGGI